MGKWFAGGANKLTLARIPCMLVVLSCLLRRGEQDKVTFLAVAFFLTIGLVLDWADGFYAHRYQRSNPRGQFLDQFIDKWGFTYPIFGAVTDAAWPKLPGEWIPFVIVMLVLDTVSCRRHHADYLASLKLPKVNLNNGAVSWGKIKFVLQNVAICVAVASLCPPDARHWLSLGPIDLSAVGRACVGETHYILSTATVCAVLSLRKRAKRASQRIPPSAPQRAAGGILLSKY